MNAAAVLVVEDDISLREALCDTLEMAGIQVRAVADGNAALKIIEHEKVSVVVSDVHMRPMDGHALLQKLKAANPNLPVVLMTAYGSVENAVKAMRDGASDYLVKPFEADVLLNMVNRFLNQKSAARDLIAEDEKTMRVVALAERVAAADVTVLINGDSGTGKEVIARHIHNCSARAEGPFVAINCAAIPENMLEAVLFGYEKGAFTGAYQACAGKFEQAQDGTLLLDEISEMDLGLQAKLLRVLQEKEVERLGGKKTIPLNVRVLATTNRNMREDVAAGRFREDLYYRLNVFPLSLPSLRARSGDIVPLAELFIAKYAGAAAPSLSDAAKYALTRHAWPGNVRELENVIQRALILCDDGELSTEDLQFETLEDQEEAQLSLHQELDSNLNNDLKLKEFDLIAHALSECSGSKKAAAELLGISPRTLRYKLARMRAQNLLIPGE
ncbi:Fis family transcriptional regulator [Candidatus Tenderia electrophaga]|jgi:two-component system response regulator FlrC|uniref:Fis family transcriptional regulator n=1 Tax=Candidatus Tenderia electrophaga TaxID=1748243 RepID=A0A0S2TC23_9GAMM|nr:Fis family transcriptional regulator [Candidatus Tenderia electrophaga]